MVEDALGKHVPQKMTEEEQMHAHIIKLLLKFCVFRFLVVYRQFQA